MNCKNCKALVVGNFCSNCGQNSNVDKINFRSFANEVSTTIFQVDRGFFFTFKELFIRPGFAIRDYLDGKRKDYFKPITYAIILSTFYYLISHYFGGNTFIADAILGFEEGGRGVSKEELGRFDFFVKNYAYTILLLLPFYSLASFVGFYKSGSNYLEHIVLNSYLIGQQAVFYSFFTVFNPLFESNYILVWVTLISSLAYAYWVFRQFFSEYKRIRFIMRYLLTYFLVLCFAMILGLSIVALILGTF
jgi:hypothetical protein